jgi:tetratricopeptide (TPR) repeat protein
LVVPVAGRAWERIVELRVEDNPEPLVELRRLMHLHDAYVLAGEGDGLVGEGRLDEAAACYVRAHEASPNSAELSFWAGLSLVGQGDENGGIALLHEAIATHPGWLELLRRLNAKAGPGVERARILLGATS